MAGLGPATHDFAWIRTKSRFGCSDPPSVFNELWFPKVMTEKTASCPEFRVVVSTGRRNADDHTLKVYFVLDSSHNLE
jgi:hypothetical protein